jgi:hypothetical protein
VGAARGGGWSVGAGARQPAAMTVFSSALSAGRSAAFGVTLSPGFTF